MSVTVSEENFHITNVCITACGGISKMVAEAKAAAEAFRQQLFAVEAKAEADDKVTHPAPFDTTSYCI